MAIALPVASAFVVHWHGIWFLVIKSSAHNVVKNYYNLRLLDWCRWHFANFIKSTLTINVFSPHTLQNNFGTKYKKDLKLSYLPSRVLTAKWSQGCPLWACQPGALCARAADVGCVSSGCSSWVSLFQVGPVSVLKWQCAGSESPVYLLCRFWKNFNSLFPSTSLPILSRSIVKPKSVDNQNPTFSLKLWLKCWVLHILWAMVLMYFFSTKPRIWKRGISDYIN